MAYKTLGNMDMDNNDWTYIGIIELEEYKADFHIYACDDYLVFGGACNAGFLESGSYKRDGYNTLDEDLQELCADLQVLYMDGKHYTSDNFDCNERV